MDELIQTYDDMKPIVEAIAKFHAASVVIESNVSLGSWSFEADHRITA